MIQHVFLVKVLHDILTEGISGLHLAFLYLYSAKPLVLLSVVNALASCKPNRQCFSYWNSESKKKPIKKTSYIEVSVSGVKSNLFVVVFLKSIILMFGREMLRV